MNDEQSYVSEKLELFLMYSQYHELSIRQMPSDKERYFYCNFHCDTCVVLNKCKDSNHLLDKETYSFITVNYPEYTI